MGFAGVVGAINGTHICIEAPSIHEEAYVNRHIYHSIDVQIVVDTNSKILNVPVSDRLLQVDQPAASETF